MEDVSDREFGLHPVRGCPACWPNKPVVAHLTPRMPQGARKRLGCPCPDTSAEGVADGSLGPAAVKTGNTPKRERPRLVSKRVIRSG